MTEGNGRAPRPRYPAYRPSGVAWLGPIPAHWEVAALKHSCLQSALYGANEAAECYSDQGARFIRTTDIGEWGELKADGAVYIDAAKVRDYMLKDGDLLLSRSGTIGRAFIYQSRRHGDCAYAGYLVRFVAGPSLNPWYAFYFTKSQAFADWLSNSVIQSTIGNVNGSKYANMPLLSPPVPEQQAIAAFLNREMARLDALLAAKQRLLDLLAEKRAALITRAVTRGLDSSIPLKESGVAWLGQIPAHWEVKKLKCVATLKSGDAITAEDMKEDDRFPVYGGNGLRGYASSYTHNGRFVLIGRQGALCGNINYGEGMFWASEHAVVVSPSEPVATTWLGELLRTMDLNQYSVSAAQPGLAVDRVKQLYVPVPPLAEQQAIAAYLDRQTARLDALADRVRRAMDLLREYRATLITAAVSGQIDVRGGGS
jgi:type I restriction enzyme S subunit